VVEIGFLPALALALFISLGLGFALGGLPTNRLAAWGRTLLFALLLAALMGIPQGVAGDLFADASQAEESVRPVAPAIQAAPAGLPAASATTAAGPQPSKPQPVTPLPGAAPPAAITAEPQATPPAGSPASTATAALDDGPVLRVSLPAQEIEADVVGVRLTDGLWDLTPLGPHVGWLEGTSLPGLGNNTVLAGHITLYKGNDGPFRRLARAKEGELVYVFTSRRLYTYQVREQEVLKPDDVYITEPSETPELTLLTCIGWEPKTKTYRYRLAVIADLLRVEELLEQP
jgi:sortase A